jgi:hypothetical protein
MPVFPKRRFQHGTMAAGALPSRLGGSERDYRRAFERQYA